MFGRYCNGRYATQAFLVRLPIRHMTLFLNISSHLISDTLALVISWQSSVACKHVAQRMKNETRIEDLLVLRTACQAMVGNPLSIVHQSSRSRGASEGKLDIACFLLGLFELNELGLLDTPGPLVIPTPNAKIC